MLRVSNAGALFSISPFWSLYLYLFPLIIKGRHITLENLQNLETYKRKQNISYVYKLEIVIFFFSQFSVYYCVYTAAAAAKSLQSCPTLCDTRDGSPPGSLIPGILQARTLEWVAISFQCMKVKSESEVVSDS